MKAFLKPFAFGVLSALMAIIGLWLAISLLLSSFIESWFAFYMFIIVVPPLMLGGYVSAQIMKSKFLSRYLIMGALVGAVVILFAMLFTKTQGQIGLLILLVIAGSSISVFGAYLGSRKMLKE